MATKNCVTVYGLKHNPFMPDIPIDALWRPPTLSSFIFRVENIIMDGGFALISGEAGLGKSKTLQLLAAHLQRLGTNLEVGVMERPQSSLSDFYRELGSLFSINLAANNRYGGFRALRERWRQHINATLFHPVVLIDEAQEVGSACLNELRLLSSTDFDSKCLLTVVLCGDTRLPERLRQRDLIPLGSRIRTRFSLDALDRDDLRNFLDHMLNAAGAAYLMTAGLRDALVEHAVGNPRILCAMGAEILATGAERDLKELDEKLFIELFARNSKPHRPKKSPHLAA